MLDVVNASLHELHPDRSGVDATTQQYAWFDRDSARSALLSKYGQHADAHFVNLTDLVLEQGSQASSPLGGVKLNVPRTALRPNHGYIFTVRCDVWFRGSSGNFERMLVRSQSMLSTGQSPGQTFGLVAIGVRRTAIAVPVDGGDRTVSPDGNLVIRAGQQDQVVDEDYQSIQPSIDQGYDGTVYDAVQVFQWSCSAWLGNSAADCSQLVPGAGQLTTERESLVSSTQLAPLAGGRLMLNLSVHAGLIARESSGATAQRRV